MLLPRLPGPRARTQRGLPPSHDRRSFCRRTPPDCCPTSAVSRIPLQHSPPAISRDRRRRSEDGGHGRRSGSSRDDTTTRPIGGPAYLREGPSGLAHVNSLPRTLPSAPAPAMPVPSTRLNLHSDTLCGASPTQLTLVSIFRLVPPTALPPPTLVLSFVPPWVPSHVRQAAWVTQQSRGLRRGPMFIGPCEGRDAHRDGVLASRTA
ncbi:hypothetical protein V8D89_003263 [Ganoderma adspersum]